MTRAPPPARQFPPVLLVLRAQRRQRARDRAARGRGHADRAASDHRLASAGRSPTSSQRRSSTCWGAATLAVARVQDSDTKPRLAATGGDRRIADGPSLAQARQSRSERNEPASPRRSSRGPKKGAVLPRSRLHLRRPRAHPVRAARALAVARFVPLTEHHAFLRLGARPAAGRHGARLRRAQSQPIATEKPASLRLWPRAVRIARVSMFCSG